MNNKTIKSIWVYFDKESFPKGVESIPTVLSKWHDSGINLLFPLVQNNKGEVLYHKTEHPIASEAKDFDWLFVFIKEARKLNMDVHPWIMTFAQGKSLFGRKNPELLCKDKDGNQCQVIDGGNMIFNEKRSWLCPSREEVREYALSFISELADNYDIQGIHLDYIRFGENFGFCDHCKSTLGKNKNGWIHNRTKIINSFVKKVKNLCSRKDLKLSAAVYSPFPWCVDVVAQDWIEWAKKGWIDILIPMNYWGDDMKFKALCEVHKEALNNSVDVLQGITTRSSCSVDVFNAIDSDSTFKARLEFIANNFGGFCLFSSKGVTSKELQIIKLVG